MRPTTISRFLFLCGFSGVMTKPMKFDIFQSLDQISGFFKTTPRDEERKINATVNSFEYYNTPQIIRRAGYPAESHVIQTEDGYLLTLHRIPGDNNSTPVLLQHGLLCSSTDWVITGKNRGLAFILADQGYDVWLGNIRGNTYSRAHVHLLPSDSEFWNFSFHEMGMYDLPAMISYITNLRSQLLHTYIGHSMGTTMFYVMASSLPHIAENVKMMISLAPVAFLNHIQSPVRYFAPIASSKIIDYLFGKDEFLPQNIIVKILANGCRVKLFQKKICANVLFLICGFDEEQFDYKLLPEILHYVPAGTSTKTVIHYNQEMVSGKFRQYDYGSKKNRVIYNATEPPEYNLFNITVPIALFYADNDWLADPQDVKRLYGKLPNVIDLYRVPFPPFNHLDFIWAKDVRLLVYKRVLEIMKTGKSPMTES